MAQSSNSSRQGRPAQTSYDSNAIPKSTSAQCRPVTVKRAHQRPFNTTHSANLGHGTSSWADSSSGTPKANKNRPSSIQAYEPNVYISKFMNDLEPTGAAAKRQRVGGFDGSSQPTIDASLAYSTFVPAQAPTMSPCTKMQSLDAPFVSGHANERPASSLPRATAGFSFGESNSTEAELLSSMGCAFVDQDLSFIETFPSAFDNGDQYAQRTDRSYGQAQDVERPCQAQDMERTWSQQSDWSTSSAASTDLKATERRRKHIENGRQTIAPKSIPGGPKSTSTQLRTDDSLNPHHHIDPSIRRKEAISKTPYVRPHHPKLYCTLCQDHPTGFRGEHELRRHQDRAHADSRKVWICVEPTTESEEGWRPQKPLGICKQCKQRKEYNVCYNAAAHLRRAHFCPRKRGRKAKGEERESRGGKAGGHWPPIEWLKASGWLQEVETTSAHLFTQDATLSKLDTSFIDDFLDEEDNFEFAPDSAIDFQRAAFAAENLGLQMYPTYTDWTSGYPTPRLDSAPRAFFPAIDTKANVLHAPIDTDCFEAPAMAYTLSAPPAMQSAPLMFDVDSELAAHNAIGLLYQEDVQMSIPFM
ncbi:hypothetical protein LTR91_007314 [Friedmanniomyces endolithicus]|uniref:DUF7896 domain-containing protein n=1 Tax=Friedmanniomyces endolithicus TaxID=329885 RepID=A0AAN6KQF9_9PEZI|nr:hypothetical protein LTR94_002797 [Friedmanniomyces endolithicus]KAK0805701.1 hypothetical protein LTR59_003923 [Friedmanniomyces endolithicus]KAK0809808.1 hypothetical protein LTR38_004138 [Friedmanniomyces endolithicus]KAK0862072.1 hypothetical protein LTS02_007438 [Friedmanniomyces endolithicus]KAK0917272.1 hypothetical protein LTR57_012545 [Friedmanniomyces endolithicus]